MTKFSVSYTRKVQTRPYENITINLTSEFDTDEVSFDYAHSQIRSKVEEWIKDDLQFLGVRQ